MFRGNTVLFGLFVIVAGIQSRKARVQLIGGTVWVDVVTTPPSSPPSHQQRHKLHVVSTLVLDGAGPCALSSSPWLCWEGCDASWNQIYACPAQGPNPGGRRKSEDGPGWHMAHAAFEVAVKTRGWAALWNVGCCWAEGVMPLLAHGTLSYSTENVTSWSNPAFVRLGVRPDTGRPNASPRAAVMPLVRLNNRCNATVRVRAMDPDGDRVRCTFAAVHRRGRGTEGSIENAVIDSDACEIRVGAPLLYPVGRFAVALSVSDFSRSVGPQGNAPLSLLPLQFLLEFVASPLPCSSEPRFVPGSPRHGAQLSATIARKFTMAVHLTVSAGSPGHSVYLSRVTVLTVAGVLASPPVSDPSRPGVFLSTVAWTPRPRQLDSNWLCFYAEDSEGRQSEVRCVDVVVTAAGDLDVVCSGERMSVTLRREALHGFGAADLALALPGPGCSLVDDGQFVTFDIGLLSCGTTFQEDAQQFVFTQRLKVKGATNASIITYHIRKVDIILQCVLKRVLLLSSRRVRPGMELVSLSHAERGELSAAMRFYDAADFSHAYDGLADFPLRPSNFQRLYFECALEGANSSLGLVLVTQSCYATPSRDPADPVQYPLISRRCISEKWVMNHTTDPRANRFSFLAFAFLDHPNVYLHCGVMACLRGSAEPGCVVTCPPPAVGGPGGRGERESMGSFLVLTGGPIVLPRGSRNVVSSTRDSAASASVAAAVLAFALLLLVVARTVGKGYWRATHRPPTHTRSPTSDEQLGHSTPV